MIRGQKVLTDADLATLYGVPTKRMNEQVRRNLDRFPEDLMFRLTDGEFEALRSQFATSKRGGRRYVPYVFTEHGALMAASVHDQAIAGIIATIRQMMAPPDAKKTPIGFVHPKQK